MIKIIEQNVNSEISYLVQTIINETVIEEHEIRCKATTVNREGVLYYLLFDRNFKLNQSVFNYINIYMDNLRKSPQTKDKTLVALKYLHSYLSIFNIELKEMTHDEASKLFTFLFGYSQTGVDINLSFNSVRSASSVNDYLSIMRTYIRYLHYKNHPLLEGRSKNIIIANALTGEVQEHPSFDIKAKEYHRTQVPKHITLEEFIAMHTLVHNSGDMRLECIIRLMYESGMRSGEVLSTTFEDLSISYDEKQRPICKVKLRNRITNKTWQSPKFLMKVKSKEDYKLKSYKQRGFGYEDVMISKSLYNLILEYMEDAHPKKPNDKLPVKPENKHSDKLNKIHYNNWLKYNVTDSVENDFKEPHNFYVFINSLGKPLSKKTLDSKIKDLFASAGVKVNNDGGKFDGLCHRFRHGFAMYQVNYNHVPLLLLKELMRHSSIESMSVYYTPEASTIIKIQDEMSKSLYELIPEFDLKKELNYGK